MKSANSRNMIMLFKYTIRALSAIVLVLYLIVACKNGSAKEEMALPSELSHTAGEENPVWPKPDSYLDGIPVYNTFADLEPIFRFENDTTYVVNFWATWCEPCRKELPYFEEFNEKFNTEKVKVVLVSLDFPKQLKSKLVPYVQKQQLKSKVVVLLDGKYNNWLDKVSPEWSGAIPATIIYKGGQQLLVATPFENYEELKKVVTPYL